MKKSEILIFALLVISHQVQGFIQSTKFVNPRHEKLNLQPRLNNGLSAKARGRRRKKDMVGGGNESSGVRTNINWCPMPPNQKLPEEEGKIGLLDTELPTMKDSATNPTGAVAVVKAYNGQTYCFGSSCPSCKIPLTKARVVSPPPSSDDNADEDTSSPRIVCDFCKASYTLKDGSKVKSTESGGLFGGVIKSIFSAQDGGPLPMYKLGERNGKIVIAVD